MAATTFQGMATSHDVLISLYTKSSFVAHQPDGWMVDKGTGKLKCVNDDVNVLVHRDEKRIFGDSNVIQVNWEFILKYREITT